MKMCPEFISTYKDCTLENGKKPTFIGELTPGTDKVTIDKSCWNGSWYERMWTYKS